MRGNSNLIRVNKADGIALLQSIIQFSDSRGSTRLWFQGLTEAVIIFLPDLFQFWAHRFYEPQPFAFCVSNSLTKLHDNLKVATIKC